VATDSVRSSRRPRVWRNRISGAPVPNRSSPRTRGPSLCLNQGLSIWQRLDSRVRGNERGAVAFDHYPLVPTDAGTWERAGISSQAWMPERAATFLERSFEIVPSGLVRQPWVRWVGADEPQPMPQLWYGPRTQFLSTCQVPFRDLMKPYSRARNGSLKISG
jgi:hypothetical protein